MAKKKQSNKRKQNKKIQKKIIVQNINYIENNNVIPNNEIANTNIIYKDENEEKGKKKKSLKIYWIIPFFFLIGLSILFILEYNKKSEDSIQTTFEYHKIINIEELNNVIELIKLDDYQSENLLEYLEYFNQYDAPLQHIIIIVNNNLKNIEYNDTVKSFIEHKNFINDNLKRYLDYYSKYNLDIDKTIIAVNNNLDKDDIKLNHTTESFMKQKYFIADRLKRYLKYHQKHSNLSYKEIVSRINSNLDKTFYKDTTKADLNKGNLILVNKFYYLESSYEPSNLVNISKKYGNGKLKKDAYNAFKDMYNDAQKKGLYLYISSPYRSYDRQNTLYTNYSNIDGTTNADKYSARPGYSEHQTGLSFDLGTASNHSINDFEKSEEFKWVKKNAHKYGFILRYPYGKTYITGYIYEPWHYRYVGIDVATYIYENNITFEEYYAYFIESVN